MNKPNDVDADDRLVRRCDVQSADMQLLDEFDDGVRMLTDMVEEAFVTTPQYLLSPVLRELIRDKARAVRRIRDLLRNHLCTDNPGKPLRD